MNPEQNRTPVRVELGERSYSIVFYNDDLGGIARDLAPFCPERALILSNDTIWGIHGAAMGDALKSAGVDFSLALVPDGERFKTLETVSSIYDQLIEERFSRRACIVAFGGGVVGDMAGFAAATYLRGVAFVQVPTTVVSMVDSSVGGKTGVDHPLGKNLIGAFYQPRLVAVDAALLRTLDKHNVCGGFAEVIKYGVIHDASFFEFLEQHIEEAIGLEANALTHAIRVSCETKARVVASDERESGLRAILNYGHTFGHAIETAGAYQETQFHGQAVGIGMVAAAELASRMNLCPTVVRERIERLLTKAGLPVRIPSECRTEELINRMFSDKKVRGGKIRFVLPREIGVVELRDDASMELVRAVISDLRA